MQVEALSRAESGGAVDWRSVRVDFPATRQVAYLRSAATGLPAPQVAAEVARFHAEMIEGGDSYWESWIERRESARRAVATLINAEPDEIAFTANTSVGMNLIVDACEKRGAVISCELEFPVSTLPWLHRGIAVKRLAAHRGVLHVEDIERATANGAGIICLSHVQYSNGLRLDLQTIGEGKRGRTFVVNASQSAGVLPIDVKRMKIDALCATGHKWLLSGFGTGFVYISRELLAQSRPRAIGWMSTLDPFGMRNDDPTFRGDAAARAEIGVPAFGSIFALGAGVRFLSSLGSAAIEQRALNLNRYLTTRLAENNLRILSPIDDEATRSAETLVHLPDPTRAAQELFARGVLITQKPEGIRIATHFYNNEDDIERLIESIGKLTHSG